MSLDEIVAEVIRREVRTSATSRSVINARYVAGKVLDQLALRIDALHKAPGAAKSRLPKGTRDDRCRANGMVQAFEDVAAMLRDHPQ